MPNIVANKLQWGYFFFYILVFCLGCGHPKKEAKAADFTNFSETNSTSSIEQDSIRSAFGFDFPVGKPNAKGYYNAQSFGENNHLGEDWNAITGGNSDLGDPIYSIGVGKVVFAEDLKGGWGNVVRVVHYLSDDKVLESVYAHCDTIMVKQGNWVERGEQIGTVGNANGVYLAHLHLEIRDSIGMHIGAGYSQNRTGYINPTAFIKANRKVN